MKYIKHIILTAMAVVVMTGAWAQTSPEKQSNGSWQFTMPAANKLLEVENYNTYTLTLASNDNTMGTVELLNSYTLTFTGVNSTAEPIVIPYYDGDSITLGRTCGQMAQDFFAGYSYNTVSTPTKISCDQQGLTVKGVFTDTLVITFSGSETKTIQVTCTSNMSKVTEIGNGNYTVIDGAIVTVKATPADNYRFVNWTDENSNVMGTAAQMTFTVTGDTAVTGNFAVQESRLDSVRTTWEVYINEAPTAVFPTPYSDTDTMGYVIIPAGADVKITPKPEGQAAMVSKLELIDKTAPSCRLVDLSQITADSVIQDCDTLTGTLAANVKISIAAGATVVLENCTILYNGNNTNYAGLTLLGDGTLVLADGTSNTIVGGLDNQGYSSWPGIFVPKGKTLTINGNTGELNAARGENDKDDGAPAGIGASWSDDCGNIVINGGIIKATGGGRGAGIGGCGRRGCGNITINGGTVTANGGDYASGIGLGGTNQSSYTDCGTCGDITINGGTVTANGGKKGAGIGTGSAIGSGNVTATKVCGNILINGGTVETIGGEDAPGIGTGNTNDLGKITCGTITITDGVTRVTATKGQNAPNSIGIGKSASAITNTCGTIMFGTQQMYNGSTWTTTPTSGETYGGLKLIISNTDDTWELTCRRVDLSQITADSVMQDGDVLTGTLTANVKISIANGATVTLNNATINGTNNSSYNWAGITCLGDATIILSGTNTVKGFNKDYPGIQAAAGKTLTINGTGSLTASSNGYSAGIGGGSGIACGNIEIQGGTITATGGERGAGIGGAYNASCGNITISGGTVNATGGEHAAGIGGGRRFTANVSCGNITISGGTVTATGGADAAGIGGGRGNNNAYKSSCGTIAITTGVTQVTATKGSGAPNSIGAGLNGTCGTVTIGGTQGAITDSPYTYPPQP